MKLKLNGIESGQRESQLPAIYQHRLRNSLPLGTAAARSLAGLKSRLNIYTDNENILLHQMGYKKIKARHFSATSHKLPTS